MRHVVQFSGGVGSWATAKRVAERHGTENLTLLFADTMIEDADLYRFLDEAAENVGGELVKISQGKTIWDVFKEKRFLGNSRIDPCSRVLKREPLRKWIEDNCDPDSTVIYFGIDWSEIHRFERAAPRWEPWRVAAPMTEKPYMSKAQQLDWLRDEGIEPPRLYKLGFPHNNCGGGCVKAGQGHFAHLRKQLPEVYAEWEKNENELREMLGDVSILRDRRVGQKTTPLTLTALRERLDAQPKQVDMFDWGGCGCALDEEEVLEVSQ